MNNNLGKTTDVFEVWFPLMGVNEGGFVNHPSDPGGATNRGITLDTFRKLAPEVLGIPGTLDNLKRLTAAQQKLIAKWFWNNLGDTNISTYQIRNWGIQYQAIEQYWGSGGANMHPLQRAANRFNAGLTTDGRFGTRTLNALNAVANQEALYHAVYEERLNYYDVIIARNPALNAFRNGWQKRLMESYVEGCKLMNYRPKDELHDRLIKWSPRGPSVWAFQRAVPGARKLNGQPFTDTGFIQRGGSQVGPPLAVSEQGGAKTDVLNAESDDEKKNFA